MIVFIDGFGHYATTEVGLKWTSTTGTASVSYTIGSTYGRYSAGGARFTDSATFQVTVPAQATYIVGFSFLPDSLTGSFDRYIVTFRDGSSFQLELAVDHTTGQLYILRNGTLVGSASTSTLTVGTWVYIEWKVTINSSIAAHSNVVKVDGVTWIDLPAGSNTQATGNATVSNLVLGTISGGTVGGSGFGYSDLYLLDTTGSFDNDFLGVSRVVTQFPTGAGTTTGWSLTGAASNHAAVAENPNDGDTSYVSATSSVVDTYTKGVLGVNPTTVGAVQVCALGRYDDAGPATLGTALRLSGTNYFSTAASLTSSYKYVLGMYSSRPSDSAAWTGTDVDGIETGVKLATGTSVRVTQVATEILRSVAISGSLFTVSASNSVTLTPTTGGRVAHNFSVSSTTNMALSGSGAATDHVPTIYSVSASSGITIAQIASVYDAKVLLVSASTGLVLSPRAYSPAELSVSASTGFFVYGIASMRDTRIYVSASTSLTLSHSAPLPYTFGPKPVSASSAFAVGQLTSVSNPGPRFASASTGLSLASVASVQRLAILMVSATTRLGVSSTGSEVRAFAAAAASGLSVSAAGRQNRDIRAAAVTSVGLGNAPTTGNLKHSAGSNTFYVSAAATASKAGTPASSAIALVDLAQAVVWIPWRKATLALPPGGGLPHS